MALKYWLPVVLLATLIWVGSSFPPPPLDLPRIAHLDKLVHASVFGFLALLLSRAFYFYHKWQFFKVAVWSVVIASLYGLSDEIHQRFVPGRTYDLWDWAADSTGALLAQFVFLGILVIREKLMEKSS